MNSARRPRAGRRSEIRHARPQRKFSGARSPRTPQSAVGRRLPRGARGAPVRRRLRRPGDRLRLRDRRAIDGRDRSAIDQGADAMKLLSPQIHGMVDYLLGVLFIGAPFWLDFVSPLAQIISLAIGASVLLMS